MVFNSISFFIFFAVVLILHHMPFPWNVKKFNLLIASYIFYGAWNPPFLFLLWFVNLLDWFVGSALGRLQNERLRFGLLMFSLIANLGLLALFKYSSFLLDSASVLLAWFGIAWSPPHLEVVLPIGISFYTFHTMAYTIDVYRRAVQPWKSFLDFGVYVAFFPQLVAGPTAGLWVSNLLFMAVLMPVMAGAVFHAWRQMLGGGATAAPVAQTHLEA